MVIKNIIGIMIILFSGIHVVMAEENEHGIVRAWFNDKNATEETIQGLNLKIGEPVEVKIEVVSKINGNIYVQLYEPGVTEAFKIINGPSAIGKTIPNYFPF